MYNIIAEFGKISSTIKPDLDLEKLSKYEKEAKYKVYTLFKPELKNKGYSHSLLNCRL